MTIVAATSQHVTPEPGDWIADGLATVGAPLPLLVDLRNEAGEPEDMLGMGELAGRFGRRDEALRTLSGHFVDAHGDPVQDFGQAALVNTITGLRVPLKEVLRLLGCLVDRPGVAALAPEATHLPTPSPSVAAAPGAGVAACYTTRKAAPVLPDGKSRSWLLDNIKAMTAYGARKVGRDWTIPCDGYERWRTAQDTAQVRASAPGRRGVDTHAIAESTLAKAGLRPTKGGS
jgi:hypothetical protein